VAAYDYRALAAVFAGGVVGTLARGGLTAIAPTPDPTQWPWSTFVANVVGAFLIGYFTTRLLERLPVSSYRRPFLGTGVCGGLTTFSTMQIETLGMIEHGKYLLAVGYDVTSVTLGLLAVYLGTATVRKAQLTG
jgi:CrcB protein